jgi:hypothetical protein
MNIYGIGFKIPIVVGACTPSIKREFLQIPHDSKKQRPLIGK